MTSTQIKAGEEVCLSSGTWETLLNRIGNLPTNAKANGRIRVGTRPVLALGFICGGVLGVIPEAERRQDVFPHQLREWQRSLHHQLHLGRAGAFPRHRQQARQSLDLSPRDCAWRYRPLKLFWKIYLAVFTSFVAVVGAISYGISARQICRRREPDRQRAPDDRFLRRRRHRAPPHGIELAVREPDASVPVQRISFSGGSSRMTARSAWRIRPPSSDPPPPVTSRK